MAKIISAKQEAKEQFADQLRQAPTPAEQALWAMLGQWGLHRRFVRQKYIGGYIADFWHPTANLVIEADGTSHEHRQEYDATRDQVFQEKGIRTLRFSNSEIFNQPDKIKERLFEVLGLTGEPTNSKSEQPIQNPSPYIVNPYGERVSFSFQCGGRRWRNSIHTRGAAKFDKTNFCPDVERVFCVEVFLSLGLVVLESTYAYRNAPLQEETFTLGPTDFVTGIGRVGSVGIAPYRLERVRPGTSPSIIREFLHSHCILTETGKNREFDLNWNTGGYLKAAPGGGKWVSRHTFALKTPGGVNFTSWFHTDARRVDLLRAAQDLEAFTAGKVNSVTRSLVLPTLLKNTNQSVKPFKPWTLSGKAIFNENILVLWKHEGVNGSGCRDAGGKHFDAEEMIEWFLKKYLRIGFTVEGRNTPPKTVDVSRIWKGQSQE